MTTGVQCSIDPDCAEPAPAETHICSSHASEIRDAGGTIPHYSFFDNLSGWFGSGPFSHGGAGKSGTHQQMS